MLRAATSGAYGQDLAAAAAAAVLALEVAGSAAMWAPVPVAWMWVGAQVYALTGSVATDGGVVLGGFLSSAALLMAALNRLDLVWIALRRRAGHDQRAGALTRVVVASAMLGLAAFTAWYYLLSHAFIIPFMPSQ